MKKRPTSVGLFSFGGSCPRVGEGDGIPLSGPCRGLGDLSQPLRLDRSPRVWHSRPQAAYSAPQPPAMRAKGPSLLGPLRAAFKLPPRRAGGERLGQGPGKGPQASDPPADSPGSAAAGGEGLAAATPDRRRRAGPEGRTAPQPPHSGGRAAPEHLRRNRRGGGATQGRTKCARLRAWPCVAEGCPRATEAANLTGPGLPGLGRHITPTAAGGRGGRRPAAQGGQGSGPQAAGGGRDGPEGRTGAPTTARRRWPPWNVARAPGVRGP